MRAPARVGRLVCALLSSSATPRGPVARLTALAPATPPPPDAAAAAVAAPSAPAPAVAPSPLPVDLYALSDEEVKALIAELGQPAYRAKQLLEWLYDKRVASLDSMGNLPAAMRAQLKARATLGSLEQAVAQTSRDGTRKYLWRLSDGREIETVMMPYADGRRTACISSQVGCAMGCKFCATGQMGFTRDLSTAEIFEQALRVSQELHAKGERLSNVVLMGMGEPFRNYDAVMAAVALLRTRLGIGARHITISTVGVAPMIRRFGEEGTEVKLAVSLHVANDAARSRLMPVNRRYALAELMDACRYYQARTNRRITFEWALICGENDSREEAAELGRLLRGLKCHVNLIPLNPTAGFEGKAPPVLAEPGAGANGARRGGARRGAARRGGGGGAAAGAGDQFIAELARHGVPATMRVRRGIDIDAGCGQLANKAKEQTA